MQRGLEQYGVKELTCSKTLTSATATAVDNIFNPEARTPKAYLRIHQSQLNFVGAIQVTRPNFE